MICPRCNRVNDRSPFVLGFKFLAVVLFVCTVTLVVRVAARVGGDSVGDEFVVAPGANPTPTAPPDLRF